KRPASPRLLPEVVEVELVDESLHGELNLRALAACGNPVAHTDDFDAAKLEPSIEAEELARVAGQPREIFDPGESERGRRGERRLEELMVAGAMFDPEAGEGRIVELRATPSKLVNDTRRASVAPTWMPPSGGLQPSCGGHRRPSHPPSRASS